MDNEVEQLRLELRKSQLKNQALLERVSELSTQFESRVADLRVNVTMQSTEIERLENELVQATKTDPDGTPDENSSD